jgi:3-methyladenine DNA glycosylase AlkD
MRSATGSGRADTAAARRALRAQADSRRAIGVARYFKTGPGEYGEGDRFIGVTVPAQRRIARQFRDLPLTGIDALLTSSIHEERSTALLILVDQFTRTTADDPLRNRIFRLYMNRLGFINNWDLVDASAAAIVGGWIYRRADRATTARSSNTDVLDRLARSQNVWSRRIAMIATLHAIVRGDHRDAIRIATRLVHDEHDLIQKAVGWMLREVGKRASVDALRLFLERHAATMPRTALRYAIERLPAAERMRWMQARKLVAPVTGASRAGRLRRPRLLRGAGVDGGRDRST